MVVMFHRKHNIKLRRVQRKKKQIEKSKFAPELSGTAPCEKDLLNLVQTCQIIILSGVDFLQVKGKS